jgi:uncharacterized protein YndB with AHSA1/START domain
MSETDITDETIIVDCDLEEPPHKVWRALTEPELLAAWLGPNDIRPEVGHRFSVAPSGEGGPDVQCEVLEAEPNRSITFSWREEPAEGPAVESQVSWTLIPTYIGGTRLRIVHDGFAPAGRRILAMAGCGISGVLAPRIRGLLAGALRLAA